MQPSQQIIPVTETGSIKTQNIQKKICQYYVVRKKRYCKFQVMKGSQYCRLHCVDSADRIMCPYEVGTYVLVSNYQNHLKICPKYQQKVKQQRSQWFTKDINTTKNQSTNQQQCSIKEVIEQQQFSIFVPKLIRKFFDVFEKQPYGAWYYIDLTKQSFEGSKSTDKDQIQCDLILDLVVKYNLQSIKNIYVQFGAGKGLLSSTIAKSFGQDHSKNILLQMQARRMKFDMYHRQNPYFQRFRSNVGDFDLGKIRNIMIQFLKDKKKYTQQDIQSFEKQLSDCKLVGVCKHMCGMATDLSISALKNAQKQIPIAGTVMATCCHHRCSYETFQNIKYFQQLGFTAYEISLIFKMSSWGVMRTKQQKWWPQLKVQQFILNFKQQKGHKFNQNQRQIIGKACKRLIDRARMELLKGLNLKVQFIKYCDYDVTPQNFTLICH